MIKVGKGQPVLVARLRDSVDALRGDTTGNGVCRAHNSSTTTKKRIRQVLCEDILKCGLTNLEGKMIEQSHISTSRLQAQKSFLMSHRAAGINDKEM